MYFPKKKLELFKGLASNINIQISNITRNIRLICQENYQKLTNEVVCSVADGCVVVSSAAKKLSVIMTSQWALLRHTSLHRRAARVVIVRNLTLLKWAAIKPFEGDLFELLLLQGFLLSFLECLILFCCDNLTFCA